jgi:hypothetical protein
MVNESRQAGVSRIDSGEAFQERFEAAERLRDDLAHIKKRWDNRLILEQTPLWEGYLNGRFEVVLYVDWRIRSHDYQLACSIAPHGAVFGFDYSSWWSSGAHIDIFDGKYCNGGHDEVVFVDVVQIGDGIKVRIPTRIRFYLVPNEPRDLGDGFLYRSISTAGFMILPLTPEWEIDSPVPLNAGRLQQQQPNGPETI